MTSLQQKPFLAVKTPKALADSCVSSGLVFWEGTEWLANWGDNRHAQDVR